MIPREAGGAPPSLVVIVTGGPKQQVLRPAQLESPTLAELLSKSALFGPDRNFELSRGTDTRIENHSLHIEQRPASILLSPLGDLRIVQPGYPERADRRFSLPALIEEDVQEKITRAFRFAGGVLDDIDTVRRLGTVVPVVAMIGARTAGWKTRREQDTDPNRVTMRSGFSDTPSLVVLTPPSRPRPVLMQSAEEIAEDFTVLLRRDFKNF